MFSGKQTLLEPTLGSKCDFYGCHRNGAMHSKAAVKCCPTLRNYIHGLDRNHLLAITLDKMAALGFSHAREHQKLQSRDDFTLLCCCSVTVARLWPGAQIYRILRPRELKCSLTAKTTHGGDPHTASGVIKVPSNCHQTLIAAAAV